MSANKKPDRNTQRRARQRAAQENTGYQHALQGERELLNALTAAARRVAVPDILGEWDQLVLACEAYDLNFDPASLDESQRTAVLQTWREAVAARGEAWRESSAAQQPERVTLVSQAPGKCIRKVYFYGDSAGEELLDFEDFWRYHIQDFAVALDCAETLLVYGESSNDAPDDDVMERYTVTDRAELARQIELALADENAAAAEFDLSLLEEPVPFTAEDAKRLAKLEAAFELNGGRGVEVAEELDALRRRRLLGRWFLSGV